MKCKLSKVQNEHDRLRDDVIEGECFREPALGEQFKLYAAARDTHDEDYFRVVSTSPVKYIIDKNTYLLIQTESGSTYRIKLERV